MLGGYLLTNTLRYCYTVQVLTLPAFHTCLLLDFNNISHNSTLIQHSYSSLPMSIESSKVLRSGKVLTDPSSHSSIKNTNCSSNFNMESSSNSADEINQYGKNSPTNENSAQITNDERFNHLQNEMSMLKAMMEKIISQNEERDKQNGGSIATSSYAVGTSNMVTGVNRTHRNHRNQFHDDEYDEDYEDAPSNTTESALLNAIQDLPRKLQKKQTRNYFKHMYQI